MPAVTDLVNYSLRLIGGARITSLTDGSNNANVANDMYEILRDSMLRAHNWNFATLMVKLAKSAGTPTFEFDNAFALPGDWLRTIQVSGNDAGSGALIHRVVEIGNEGSVITSVEEVFLRYVYRVTDPNRMIADFRMALINALARDMSPAIPNSNTKFQLLDERANRTLRIAKHTDAMGSMPEQRPSGSWISSRGGFRTHDAQPGTV